MNNLDKYQHYALDINNNIIHIKDTNNLEVQQYYCPYCHNEMITRRGNIRQWHFAHKTDKCSYDKYLHSIAETMIMDWFNKNQSIILYMENNIKCDQYNSCVFYNTLKCQTRAEKSYELKNYYTKCIKEHIYEGFVADLYWENNTKPKSPIFIEICVTHKCTQEKINSGIRIIELDIQSEEDILDIVKSNKLVESKKVKLYNFKRKDITVDDLEQDFQKYILYSNLKHYVEKEKITCRNYSQYRKGIYEISLPYDDCIPNFINGGGLYMVGRVKAYLEGYFKKDCQLCIRQREDGNNDKFCILYKKCGNPKYCKENDASKCSMFKENTNAINNAVSDLNEYLKNGNIDIWKADK